MSKLIAVIFLNLILALASFAQTSAFTYQGHLSDGGQPANGSYDIQIDLYDTPDVGTGTRIGTQGFTTVVVVNGTFSLVLDFGPNAFPGADRYLQFVVQRTGNTGIPTLLSPREKVTSAPYADRSLSAATADNAQQLSGVAASQFVLTSDARLGDARSPLPGSGDYVQNTTTPQASSNFNVTGTGKADTFDAGTQFNLAGARVLSGYGTNNLFAGQNAAQSNPTGDSNSFFGANSGQTTADGRLNSFFGTNSGKSNTSGSFNAFFGAGSGFANFDGNNNAFFGYTSGRNNSSGANNSFFGNAAGFTATTGSNNSLFGWFSGNLTTIGNANSFFGARAGAANTSGFENSFFGTSAGSQNLTGNDNTIVGNNADLGSGNLFNSTAIGAQSFVTQSNSLILGSINGVNNATADTNVGIGTTSPTSRLHVVGDGHFTGNLTVDGSFALNSFNAITQYNLNGARVISNAGTNNFFAGQGTGNANTTGSANAFFGATA